MTRTILSSASQEVVIGFDVPFVLIGERINPTGRKLLAAEMKVGDFPGIYHMVEIEEKDWHLLPKVPKGRDSINLDDARGTTVRVGRGQLWITQYGDPVDHVLAAGDAVEQCHRERVGGKLGLDVARAGRRGGGRGGGGSGSGCVSWGRGWGRGRGGGGSLVEKRGRAGCQATSSVPGCTTARAMQGVSSLAVSSDGRFLYGGSNKSNAVTVFQRVPASR